MSRLFPGNNNSLSSTPTQSSAAATATTTTSTTARRNSVTTIEECLFGPSKQCPLGVWEATTAVSITPPPSPSAAAAASSSASNTSSSVLLFDDLGSTRWASEVTPGSHTIPLSELRRLSSQGQAKRLRPVAWRVLSGYLPPELSQWKTTLLERRKLYQTLVKELFAIEYGSDLRDNNNSSEEYGDDHDHDENPDEETKHGDQQDRNSKTASGKIENELKESSSFNSNKGKAVKQREFHEGKLAISASKEEELLLQQQQQKEDDEEENQNDDNKNAADDTSSYVNMIPQHIREEWKKEGKDLSALTDLDGSNTNLNTLMVSDRNTTNDTNTTTAAPSPPSKPTFSPSSTSDAQWMTFFENATLLDEIRKDVVRTHPDLEFYTQKRYAAIERILFVWAKLNQGVRYVQGMNEIVGTMYYVLASDEQEQWSTDAEADTYFLLNTLLAEMRDVFVPDLDQADTGLQGRISNMTALLSLHDPEVRCHLVDLGIDPAFYAIRWLTTLLSREFTLQNTIRLWDSMFASTHKDNFMRYVCVTMVMLIRDQLLKGDFSTCLRLLQKYPPSTNIDSLLEASRALWIYESQVTLACHKGGISLHQALLTITPPPSIIMAYGLPGGVARIGALSDPQSGSSNRGRSSGSGVDLMTGWNISGSTGGGGGGFLRNYFRGRSSSGNG